jgi:hypothetical protein
MFIDERKRSRKLDLWRSPFVIALGALGACITMMTALVEDPALAGAAVVSFPTAPTLHAASLLSDNRLAFLVLLGGFIVMAGGCFVLSRRSLRDALRAESRRTKPR